MIDDPKTLRELIGNAPLYVTKKSEEKTCFCGEVVLVRGPLVFPAAWSEDDRKHTLESCDLKVKA